MGTGSFPGVKCGRGVLLTAHPLLVPRSWKSRAYTSTHPLGHTGPVTGSLYLLHTHTFLRKFVSHIRSLLMMQTNAPKRGSDFPYKSNEYFGSGSGFTQTIRTGNSLSWSREIALSSYVLSMLCIWTHSLQAFSHFNGSRSWERDKSLVNPSICIKETRV